MLWYLLSHKLEFVPVDHSRRQYSSRKFLYVRSKKSTMLTSINGPESLSPLHKVKTIPCTYLYARILCTVALEYFLRSDLCLALFRSSEKP